MAWFMRKYMDYYDYPINYNNPVNELEIAYSKYHENYQQAKALREKHIETITFMLFLVRYYQRIRILSARDDNTADAQAFIIEPAIDFIEGVLTEHPFAEQSVLQGINRNVKQLFEQLYSAKGVEQPSYEKPDKLNLQAENLFKITAGALYLNNEDLDQNKQKLYQELMHIIYSAGNLRLKSGAISTLLDLHRRTKIMSKNDFHEIVEHLFILLDDSDFDPNNIFNVMVCVISELNFPEYINETFICATLSRTNQFYNQHYSIYALALMTNLAKQSSVIFSPEMQQKLYQISYYYYVNHNAVEAAENVLTATDEDIDVEPTMIAHYFPPSVFYAVPEENSSLAEKDEFSYHYRRILDQYENFTKKMTNPVAQRHLGKLLLALAKLIENKLTYTTAEPCYHLAKRCGMPRAYLHLACALLNSDLSEKGKIHQTASLLSQAFEVAKEQRKFPILIEALAQVDQLDIEPELKLNVAKCFIGTVKSKYAGVHPGIFWDSLFMHVEEWKSLAFFRKHCIANMLVDDCYERFGSLLQSPIEHRGRLERWLERLQQYGAHFAEHGHFAYQRELLEANYAAACANVETIALTSQWSYRLRSWWQAPLTPIQHLANSNNVVAMLICLQQLDNRTHKNLLLHERYHNTITNKLMAMLPQATEHYFKLAMMGFEPAKDIMEVLNRHLLQLPDKPIYWHRFVLLNTELHKPRLTAAERKAASSGIGYIDDDITGGGSAANEPVVKNIIAANS